MAQLINVKPEIIVNLKLLTFVGDCAFLPDRVDHEFTKEEFAQLKGFISKYPCTWNRNFQGFEFEFDTEEFFGKIIETGQAPKPNMFAYHPTPVHAIHSAFELAEIDQWKVSGRRCLDPNGGGGAILRELKTLAGGEKVTIETCEIDPVNRATLETQGFKLVGDDFLSYVPDEPYHVISMNPPFTVNSKVVWIDHVMHAYSMLSDYGDLTAIIPKDQFFSDKAKFEAFRDFCFSQPGFRLVEFPKGTFETAKGIATIAIHLVGAKAHKNALETQYDCYGDYFHFQTALLLENASDLLGVVYATDFSDSCALDGLLSNIYRSALDIELYLPDSFKPQLVCMLVAMKTNAQNIELSEAIAALESVELLNEEPPAGPANISAEERKALQMEQAIGKGFSMEAHNKFMERLAALTEGLSGATTAFSLNEEEEEPPAIECEQTFTTGAQASFDFM